MLRRNQPRASLICCQILNSVKITTPIKYKTLETIFHNDQKMLITLYQNDWHLNVFYSKYY